MFFKKITEVTMALLIAEFAVDSFTFHDLQKFLRSLRKEMKSKSIVVGCEPFRQSRACPRP